MSQLNHEEMELIESFEQGEWVSKAHLEERKQQLQEIAKNTLNHKQVNILIQERDLTAIQTMASQEGIPYNTLISNILHQYISGKLVSVG
jgi:predicted DNA binding CopG/RHH family protein